MSAARICDGCGKTLADGQPYTLVRLDLTRIFQDAPGRVAVEADICGDLACAAAWFASERVAGKLFVKRDATGEAPKAERSKR